MIAEGIPYVTKFNIGKYKYPITIEKRNTRLWFSFGFNKLLTEEIKNLEGRKWHGFEDPPIKKWSASDSAHNRFQIAYLEGKNPYEVYDRPLLPFTFRRTVTDFPGLIVMQHQPVMSSHMITRSYCILAAEMGTGKTLSVIEAMEWLAINRGIKSWFYIAPKSALTAVQLEFEKWRSIVQPQFFTYDGLKQIVGNWPPGTPPPQAVVFDESSRLKSPTAQRSVTAMHLANAIREHWGDRGAVILMSGTPAPKSPLDWWFPSRVACPGFLKEGNYEAFRRRLAIMSEGQNDSGQVFAKLVAWKDDSNKCCVCGKLENNPDHDPINMAEKWFHAYMPSVNEVAHLSKRLNGLVQVHFKKECLDLPEKQYRLVECKPSQSIINAAKLISARGESVIKTMILMRELSDGFQYEVQDTGEMARCVLCEGCGRREDFIYAGPDDRYEEFLELQASGQEIPAEFFKKVERTCHHCEGTGEVALKNRHAVQVPCPKEQALLDILDQHEDVGRLVTYAGFTGSVDRCVKITLEAGWDVIRIDGRGWWSNVPGNAKELLKRFQYEQSAHPRINIVGQPSSAGMGLTLTASPSIVYYSNDFNGESRTQSEDRIHRAGMDMNRACTIYDLIHLPTDLYVLENLRKKRKLEQISMGDFKVALDAALGGVRVA